MFLSEFLQRSPVSVARSVTAPSDKRMCGWAQSGGTAQDRVCLRRKLSLPADRDHRFVGSPAVDVPEFLEIRPVEIGELLTGIGERGLELIRLHRLADGGA